MIELDVLAKGCPATPRSRLELFIEPLRVTGEEFDISTPERISAFLGQLAHETGEFRFLKEIWGPTNQQLRYERDFDHPWLAGDPTNGLAFRLGNAQAGDGKRYLGRGGIQTTGRTNTVRVLRELGLDEQRPEVLEQPMEAMRSSGFFWKSHGMNEMADEGRFQIITKGVNGYFSFQRGADLDRYNHYAAFAGLLGVTKEDAAG